MTSSLQKFVTCILFLLSHSTLAHSSEVTQIKIVSSWVGLGTPSHNELTITRKAGNYYSGGKKVDALLVNTLVSALNES